MHARRSLARRARRLLLGRGCWPLAALAAAALLGSLAPAAGADALDSSLPLQTSYRDEVMADGPSAYWRLGEASGTVAIDDFGANSGSYAGGVTLGKPGGLADGSTGVALDGVTGRMVVPASAALSAQSAVTVELWARRTKSAAYQVLVGKPGNGQSKYENYAIWLNTSNRLQAYFGNGSSYVTVTTAAVDTAWHHIVATYDNATARIYLDGALAASASSTVALTPNGLPLNLGRTNDGQYYFGGALDEVAFYQKALSAARIQAHYLKALVDGTPPTVTLTQPAAGSATASPRYAGVAGTMAGDSSTVTVRVYSGSDVGGAAVQTLSATAQADGSYSVSGPAPPDGVYTAQAEQSDASGNVGRSAPVTFSVDTRAPVASITSAPQGTVASSSATFGLASDEPGSTFECRLDGGAFAACSSPKSYSGLAEGGHVFDVRAIDAAGNVGAPASASWAVDTTAPSASIDDRPADPTSSTSADLAFSSTDAGATFECRLDGGAFAACSSPKSYSGLAEGGHVFDVRAIDAAGNVGAPASASWAVDTTAPLVTLTEPANGSRSSDPTPAMAGIAGTAAGDRSTVAVAIFAGTVAWGLPVQVVSASVGSGGQYAVDAAALPDATYTARAEQSDLAGNVGQSAATTFTIDSGAPDTTPPVVELRTPADGSLTSDATPTMSGTAGAKQGDLTDVTVLIHAGSGTSGALAQTLAATRQADGSFSVDAAPLADGVYTAYARQSDEAGNTGVSATSTFTVDTAAPTATIAADPPSPTAQTSVSIGFSSDEPGSTFECRLDGAAYAACTSPRDYTALADGSHLFAVRATDRAGNTGPADSATWTVDTAAPVVSLTTPASGAELGEAKVTFAGSAGLLPGDSQTITVRVYPGSSASGTPVQALTADRQGDGSYSVRSASLAEGTYTARAEQRDSAGNSGLSQSRTFTRADPVMIGAGDIAGCESGDGDAQTAALLARHPSATVFTLGDNAYPSGQPSEYASCYDPTWGAAKARTRPIPGGHDLATVSGGALPGQGYVDYFGAQLAPFGATATDRLKLYYSYDIGSWHVVALNAGCYGDYAGCDPSAMEQWLRQDLAAHPSACTIAMWHDARWKLGAEHGNSTFTQGLWKIAYDNGVDIVLSGHDHDYERFAPQDDAGGADPQHGVREFVVGSGGYYHYNLGTLKPNSEAFNGTDYGVLKLTLHEGGYDWQFVHEDGGTFTDSGTDTCHDAPPPSSGTPTVRSAASATANHPATSLTIARPQDVVAGDLLLAVVSHQGGRIRNMSPPSGWTAVPQTDLYETTNARIHAWYRVAGASEPASYKFTLTGGSGMAIAGGIAAIVGADPQAPVDASGGQVTGSQSSLLTAPSITTSSSDTLLVYGGAVNQPLTFVEPPGMAEQWDVRTSGQYNVATEIAVAGLPPVGATGTRSALLSAKSKGVAFLLAIRADG